MVLKLIEEGWPLDEVVFYDTGMEFDAIYQIRDQVKELLETNNIRFTELKPSRPFMYDMTEKEVHKKDGTIQKGYGWCGGPCRWGTAAKVQTIKRKYGKEPMYVGIAIDEPERLKRLDPWKSSPLETWKMTERDCLEYCRAKGYSWQQDGVDLYDILDRVSCWCCKNKNLKELKNIYLYLPEYWERLKDLQDKIGQMKKYRTTAYGDLGDLRNLEKMWADERRQLTWDFPKEM